MEGTIQFDYKIHFKDGTEYSDREIYHNVNSLQECIELFEMNMNMTITENDDIDHISYWRND